MRKLTEIVRDNFGRDLFYGLEVKGFYHAAFFEDAADDQVIVLVDLFAKPLEDIRHYDEI